MTRRRDLELHRHSLGEIRDIMNSMKTLAYMETRKLARFIDAQHTVVQSIEAAAADLLAFYPDILPEPDQAATVYLLLGSERGFCGDFNHALLRKLESLQARASNTPLLVVIGRKLHTLLETDSRVAAAIDGASTVEEIGGLLPEMVGELTVLQEKHGALNLFSLYHNDKNDIVSKRLLPPFQEFAHTPPRYAYPPQLNLPPQAFLAELTEHYLFAVLHEMLYTSFLTENRSRVTHLEGAVKHLDDEAEDLTRRYNALRQEEIIEEIEVILLSARNIEESKT